MSEILFIADDKCVLAVIDNLQPLIETEIHLETDYISGVKRIFESYPAVVFLQSRIGTQSCDKLAKQVRMLLEGEAVPLILLSDEVVMSNGAFSDFQACFDLCLPMNELNLQILQLLQTVPKIALKTAASQSLSGEEQESETIEITLPDAAADFLSPFSGPDEDSGSAGTSAPFAIDTAPVETLPCDLPAITTLPWNSEFDEDLFLTDSPADTRASEALSAFPEGKTVREPENKPGPAGEPAAVTQQRPFEDSRRIEKSDPSQLFGSMSESRGAPSGPAFKPAQRKPVQKPPPLGEEQRPTPYPKNGDRSASAAGLRGPSALPTSVLPAGATAGDALPDSVAAFLGIEKKKKRFSGSVLIGTLLVFGIALCIGALNIFFILRPGAFTETNPTGITDITAQGKVQASRPPVPQQLPSFIPQVPADPQYAATHPGWERYRADALEYLVYREQSRIRAIQVLSGSGGVITLPFLKTCIRVSTGHEYYESKNKEGGDGFQVESGTVQNGAEFSVYRRIPGKEIVGFVLSFPNTERPPEAEVTAGQQETSAGLR